MRDLIGHNRSPKTTKTGWLWHRNGPRAPRARYLAMVVALLAGLSVWSAAPSAAATATLTTQASTNSTLVPSGSSVTDQATVTGAGPTPTGTVTYKLVGPLAPGDATCSASPVVPPAPPATPASQTVPVGTVSPNYTVTTPGTYNFLASYSGDASYDPITPPVGCGDPAEMFAVRLVGTLTTQASTNSTSVPSGTSVTDQATFTPPTGGPTPTGTVTYSLVGPLAPGDATCAASPVVSPTPPATPASQTVPVGSPSPAYTVPAPGTYNFLASYSGDANYNPVASVGCGDPAERFTAIKATPTLTTTASAAPAVGSPATDTATLANGFNPTGTITFRLYGPNDTTCANPAVYEDDETVTGNGDYTSDPFVIAAAGTYRWRAFYSGDANNEAVSGACNDPNENVIVKPRITVTKTPNPANPVEPGGPVTYSIVVTNNGPNQLTITELTDSEFGDLNTKPNSTCIGAVGTPIGANGGTYSCQFSDNFTGDPGDTHSNVVTAKATDGVDTFTATASATVTIADSPSSIEVTKTALPSSMGAPGGFFLFQVSVTNTSPVDKVTIKTLSDDIYGNLAAAIGKPPCSGLANVELDTGESASCNFVGEFKGIAGESQTDTVTVTALDDDGNPIMDSDDATVAITNAVNTTGTVVTIPTTPATVKPTATPTTPASGVIVVGVPDVFLTPTSGEPGQSVIINGLRWNPFEGITLTFSGTPVQIAGVTTDATGTFAVITKIPADATLGIHTIIAAGTSGRSVSRPFTVEAPDARLRGTAPAPANNIVATGATPTTLRSGTLSRTGSSAISQATFGAILVLIGGAAAVSARRRRLRSEI